MADYTRREQESFKYEIIRQLGVLSERTIQGEPWTLEANVISWNRKAPKIDIRSWDKRTHRKMTKGITMTENEAKTLAGIIAEL